MVPAGPGEASGRVVSGFGGTRRHTFKLICNVVALSEKPTNLHNIYLILIRANGAEGK